MTLCSKKWHHQPNLTSNAAAAWRRWHVGTQLVSQSTESNISVTLVGDRVFMGNRLFWQTHTLTDTHSSRIVPFVSVAVVGSGAYSFATTVAINFQGKFMMFCEAGGRELLDTLRMVNWRSGYPEIYGQFGACWQILDYVSILHGVENVRVPSML